MAKSPAAKYPFAYVPESSARPFNACNTSPVTKSAIPITPTSCCRFVQCLFIIFAFDGSMLLPFQRTKKKQGQNERKGDE